jgi:hypothetical protein
LANCKASSVTAQHIEAPLTQKITFWIAETGFIVKMNIFTPELKVQADFSRPAADLPGAGFFYR